MKLGDEHDYLFRQQILKECKIALGWCYGLSAVYFGGIVLTAIMYSLKTSAGIVGPAVGILFLMVGVSDIRHAFAGIASTRNLTESEKQEWRNKLTVASRILGVSFAGALICTLALMALAVSRSSF